MTSAWLRLLAHQQLLMSESLLHCTAGHLYLLFYDYHITLIIIHEDDLFLQP